jgi:hypothetical protein
MEKQDLIFRIKILASEIKIDLEYSEIIINYLNSFKNLKELSLLNKNLVFLYINAFNSLSLAILSFNSLINPRKYKETNEISPFNKKLELSIEDYKKLEEINELFKKIQLDKYRHQSIAHKVFIEPDKIKNKFEVKAEMKLLNKLKRVYKKYDLWTNKTFPNTEEENDYFNYLFEQGKESILNIVRLIEKEQQLPLMPLEDVVSY